MLGVNVHTNFVYGWAELSLTFSTPPPPRFSTCVGRVAGKSAYPGAGPEGAAPAFPGPEVADE